MTLWSRRIAARALALGLALAMGPAPPLRAQEAAAPGAAALARLDFKAALDALGAAIAADPAAPAPRLARAALHRKMQRPALAVADLDALLEADPDHVAALIARAEIWEAQRAWSRARADLDRALDAAPEAAPAAAQVLAARARVNRSAGLFSAALADYEAALALSPDDPALTAARSDLIAARAESAAAEVRFDPGAVLADAFLVREGDAAAPATLHLVHEATDLAQDYAGIDRAALARAVDTGAVQLVHILTYSGRDASVWGALALICAGPEGFAATHAALAGAEGRAALNAANTGDFARLDAFLGATYAEAGLDPALVQDCARNRLRATRYLADWQGHRDAGGWRGVNLLDHWPVWVLDGTALGPGALNARLLELAPAPAASAQAETGPRAAEPEPDAPAAPPAAEALAAEAAVIAAASEDGTAQVAGKTTPPEAAAPPVPDDARAPPPAPTEPGAAPATRADGPLFPPRPEPAGDVRVPVELRGVYAPSLAECLRYLDAIETPQRIDAVLPEMNPLDGPVLGTILVTSRRVYLFNPLDTECAIAGTGSGGGSGWQGAFSCASPLAPKTGTAMQLSPAAADGTAPRITAEFGTAAPVVLRQCRALGQLGNAFAPLWSHDARACTVSVPVAPGRFTFSVDDSGNLVLRVAPTRISGAAGTTELHAVVDGTPLSDIGGRWDGTGWQSSLGPFGTAAEQLGWGMFLDVRATDAVFEARLPLFGSGAAMDALAACAPDGG